jgi:hypothetical protein
MNNLGKAPGLTERRLKKRKSFRISDFGFRVSFGRFGFRPSDFGAAVCGAILSGPSAAPLSVEMRLEFENGICDALLVSGNQSIVTKHFDEPSRWVTIL